MTEMWLPAYPSKKTQWASALGSCRQCADMNDHSVLA